MSPVRTSKPPKDRIDALVAAARRARKRAYAPYSNFHVGAAVLAGGRIFPGVNVEIASYPLSVCAERNAIAGAVVGGKRSIEAVAVVTDEEVPTPPCGGCRQALYEFGPHMLVVAESDSGRRAEWVLSSILPEAFDASSFVER